MGCALQQTLKSDNSPRESRCPGRAPKTELAKHYLRPKLQRIGDVLIAYFQLHRHRLSDRLHAFSGSDGSP
jgi:hypothetical protein